MENIIAVAAQKGASDIHIVCGIPVRFRIDGQLRDMNSFIVTEAMCEEYARFFGEEAYCKTQEIGEVDLAVTVGERRLRVNMFKQQKKISIAIRLLKDKIPNFYELGLPEIISSFSRYQNGLVLVTGETGSGKSTTLASLLSEINHYYSKHIITLEDPIEYVYEADKCVINQREVGKDTKSFANGLRAALREDPDVILVGEMRDLDTIETAITAAETGHLVFGTIHTNSAPDAIDRIVDAFPEGRQKQIRLQLSMCLKAVVSQQLLPKVGGGRVAACEIMIVDYAIANLIRESKVYQIPNTMQTSVSKGCCTMKMAVEKLLMEELITKDTAAEACENIFEYDVYDSKPKI